MERCLVACSYVGQHGVKMQAPMAAPMDPFTGSGAYVTPAASTSLQSDLPAGVFMHPVMKGWRVRAG
jgi:hypothetical protein